MLKVGLTGGIGSGKTTVTTHFMALGVPVIDADVIARELVKPGLPAYRAIIHAFGSDVLGQDGSLDRRKLRQLIFPGVNIKKAKQAEEAKQVLESILHPMVFDDIRRQVESLKSPYCILSIPLLIEVGDLSLIDRLLVIDVDPALQASRVLQRDGGTRSQVTSIIRSQIDRQTRLSYADDVLTNNGEAEELISGVDKLHEQYLAIIHKMA